MELSCLQETWSMWRVYVSQGKSKNNKKKTKTIAQEHGKATGPFPPTTGGSKYDAKIVDQFCCKTWTAHIKAKTQIANHVQQHLDKMKGPRENCLILSM